MSGERVDRRLAAILAADVAGYSRLMEADEEGTLAALRAIRRELGDLWGAEFPPDRPQRSERALLVGLHQPRVARDVGRQDRCEAPLDPFLRHGRRPYE